MKKMITYSKAIMLFMILSSCHGSQNKNEKSPELTSKVNAENNIIGTWRNVSMQIKYLDRDSIFDVPKGKWEEILKIKPIVTTYRSDYTFQSKYLGLNDSLLFTTEGNWYFENDSLFLETSGVTTAYLFSKRDKLAQFTGILDWNEDGKVEELYTGTQIKE